MQQVVCTKCRCSNQFGTIFCRNCGKKLPDLDMNHPDRKLHNEAKGFIKRLIKLIVILAILALIGAIILPIGFKTSPKLKKRYLEIAEKNYELMEKRIANGDGFNKFKLSPPEAGYIATKIITPAPVTPKEDEADTEEAAKKPEEPIDPGTLSCFINDDEITIVYTKKYYKVTQCRIEITGKFSQLEIEEDDPDAEAGKKKYKATKDPETELTYTMTGARLGHILMPKLLFPHMLELFRSMVFDRKIERIISLVEDVKVDKNDVTISFKKQIK
jgi:hypothetical protein